ncbi:S46 family peptidase [Flavisolibacter tropicus]|uniref:Dipeptidyl-peptidase n=1 Tax=Flavisolibacter tropicus TaxID=1492898 RepID=A0A172TW83_9BACT|nr:S46 family peptidase [Flavisolibacter tropicus]ANE51349.1 peptidase S46 [Flavisolibacter tropicus]
MKKILITLILFSSVLSKALADEGMWLPLLLGQQVYNDMVKKGLKLSKEQLYSVNKASLKDAVVIFGNGCTGELVSAEGLIFTNHHCGYSQIAAASTVEHNYLRDGFYAKNKGEEIPSQGLSVRFLLRIDDVTKEVMDSLQGLSGAERLAAQNRVLSTINARMSDPSKSIETLVSSLFKGNQFLAFVYQRYTDIRLVGAPPESVGKYGGDTDNWEWPRHTGDFSVFRVYGNNGQPASYAANNTPLKPKYFLPVSIKGVKEGDFAMIYGYPGSTNRYETSLGVKLATDINNPTLVKLRDVRLKYMLEEMKKDPAIKLQLAGDYASIANYWKFYDGETKQLIKYDVYGQKRKSEETFIKWAANKPEYKNLFTDLESAYNAWRPYALHRVYINEGILGSPLLAFAASLQQLEAAMVKPGTSQADIKKALDAANSSRKSFLAAHNRTSDQNIVAAVLQMYYNDVPKEQQPIGLYNAIKNEYGALDKASTYQKYAEAIFSQTMLLDNNKWDAFMRNPDATVLQQDLAFNLSSAYLKNWQSKYLPYYQQFVARNNEAGRLYLKGIMEQDPKKIMYPDATFTMRVSYGKVDDYKPRDAVSYDYVTTMKGVLEKYKPGDYEFDLPARYLELARKKDYGQYIDKRTNDLVVGFITSNDITGGNSGSPVMNGNGELIGLAFDGNYEALSHKIAFDKDLNRTINVDIRYVLWCIDKLGGASNLIKELNIKR